MINFGLDSSMPLLKGQWVIPCEVVMPAPSPIWVILLYFTYSNILGWMWYNITKSAKLESVCTQTLGPFDQMRWNDPNMNLPALPVRGHRNKLHWLMTSFFLPSALSLLEGNESFQDDEFFFWSPAHILLLVSRVVRSPILPCGQIESWQNKKVWSLCGHYIDIVYTAVSIYQSRNNKVAAHNVWNLSTIL